MMLFPVIFTLSVLFNPNFTCPEPGIFIAKKAACSWTEFDTKSLNFNKRRCQQKNGGRMPCLITFYKYGEKSYGGICGRGDENVKNN